jgi:transposase
VLVGGGLQRGGGRLGVVSRQGAAPRALDQHGRVILAETGGDMSRFPTAERLASWAVPHGNKWLTAMLVEAAGSVGRTKGANYLSTQHARLTARRGMGRAAVAVAHSMLVSAYYILSRDEPYSELGADWLARRNDQAHTRRPVAQLERLGHTVVLDPAA